MLLIERWEGRREKNSSAAVERVDDERDVDEEGVRLLLPLGPNAPAQ